ncbi:MAG: rhodanese-like domain-containing protein [Prochlorotrichaceae cyanobacterium]
MDVREPEEYAAGHIEGAVNIPLRLLAIHQAFLPDDRPLILYCSSGYRTAMGVTILHLLGIDKVYGYQPSLQGWQAAGEAIVVSQPLS